MSHPTDAKVCAVCARVLNLLEAPDGTTAWVHGLQDADHLAVPVDSDQVQIAYRCDFCNMDESAYILPVREFPLPFTGSIQEVLDAHNLPRHMSGDSWSACVTCGHYIELNQWNAVLRRTVTQWEREHGPMPPVIRTHLARLHKAIRKNINGTMSPFRPPAPKDPENDTTMTEWGQSRDTGKSSPLE